MTVRRPFASRASGGRRGAPLAVALLAAGLAGCSRQTGNPAPPRVDAPATLPRQSSTIVIPVAASLADLAKGLDHATPQTLWRIDRHQDTCVPEQRVKVFGRKLKVTPALGCRIVGQVTRGPIRLGGHGDTLTITVPIHATIRVRDVGGIIKQKTATGAAIVRANARLSLAPDWTPRAKVAIAYDWTDPPGIDFLGQRIRFTDKADAKLQGVIAGLERDLPRQLAKLRARDRLAGIWRAGFTALSLNRANPPVWMQIAPQRLGFGGYHVDRDTLTMLLSAQALTTTFVGPRPADPVPTPLPPPSTRMDAPGLRFFIPVLADYHELEPVVARALGKLARKGITLTGVGPVDATFGDVTIYATQGGRLAVGIKAAVKPRSGGLGTTKGEIWLTARPYNAANAQLVQARDIAIAGQTDNRAVNLLFALFDNEAVLASVRDGLRHDFAPDYAKVLGKARAAIAERREGDFLMSATVTRVTNGTIQATGAGLFLPVQAEGAATIRYRPVKR